MDLSAAKIGQTGALSSPSVDDLYARETSSLKKVIGCHYVIKTRHCRHKSGHVNGKSKVGIERKRATENEIEEQIMIHLCISALYIIRSLFALPCKI